jgi:16S rRNA (uracil1498-N3)-methyltransferase
VTAPLFWAPPAALTQAAPGLTLVLEGEEAHHAVSVKRLRPDQPVWVSDAAGRLISGAVTSAVAGPPAVLTVLVSRVEDVPKPDPRLILVQALTKQRRDEGAVAAATGLGVDAIIPWQADHSVVRWDKARAGRGRERWQALATAEAKVARRAWVPQIGPVAQSVELAAALGQMLGAGRGTGIVLHEDATSGIAAALEMEPIGAPAPTERQARSVYLITGPEGGISDVELAAFKAAGCQLARLGPEVLRAGLAGPAGLAVASHLLGRWAR